MTPTSTYDRPSRELIPPTLDSRRRVASRRAAFAAALSIALVACACITTPAERPSTALASGGLARIEPTHSSWIPGQAGLLDYSDYERIASRAEPIGERLYDGYRALLEEITEQEREAAERARLEALRRYQIALRRAEARRERLLAERRRELKERLRRLREKYKIEPGQECKIPEIRAKFDCEIGYPF